MTDIVMFLVFVLAGIMCDFLGRNGRETRLVITAYCLLTVVALAVVISAGSGIEVPSPNIVLETGMDLLRK